MPSTYTHNFATPLFQKDVTIDTGFVPITFLALSANHFLILLVSSLVENGSML